MPFCGVENEEVNAGDSSRLIVERSRRRILGIFRGTDLDKHGMRNSGRLGVGVVEEPCLKLLGVGGEEAAQVDLRVRNRRISIVIGSRETDRRGHRETARNQAGVRASRFDITAFTSWV